MISMEEITVKNLEGLRRELEHPKMYGFYERYVPYHVTRAELMMYEHPRGAVVEGRPGRWWIYIRLYHGRNDIYDLALWKLGPILEKLEHKGLVSVAHGEETRQSISHQI